jgi:hypothetical protein
MVPRDVLPAAVTINSVGFNITRSVGPAIGGAIVAAAGAAAAFAANSMSYFALIYALIRWKPEGRTMRCRARRFCGRFRPGSATSSCRRIFSRCCSAVLFSAFRQAPCWRFCRSSRAIWSRRPVDLRHHARSLRGRRDRRRNGQFAAARKAVERVDRPPVLLGFAASAAIIGHEFKHAADRDRPARARRLLGAGACRCSIRRCSFRRRDGWSPGRFPSTRRRRSGALPAAAGSGASLSDTIRRRRTR